MPLDRPCPRSRESVRRRSSDACYRKVLPGRSVREQSPPEVAGEDVAMFRIAIAAALIALAGTPAPAETLTPEQLVQRSVERRAVEAVIWGMPAVNFDLMLQAMLSSTAARENEIVYWSRPVNWKN